MESQAKRAVVVYAAAPEQRSRWGVAPTVGYVYFACSHKRLMAKDSTEARVRRG